MAEPEAGPGFRDQDAVAGVAGVVANLDRLVDAVAEDEVGQAGDVLGAVVGDAGEAVAVEEDLGSGGDAVFAVEAAGVDEVTVGEAAGEGEVLAAAALQLFRSGTVGADDPHDGACEDDDSCGEAANDAGIVAVEQLREMVEGSVHVG